MKGNSCSWRDMRKIKHVLENAERLKGEMSALTNCVDRTTLRSWERMASAMELVNQHDAAHIAPTHLDEIVRRSPREAWPEWVDSCEKNKWTVAQLRSVLIAAKAADVHETAQSSMPKGKYTTIVVDPPWSYGNKSGRHGTTYSTLSFEEIVAFDIQQWVPEECHLYLWTTDAFIGRIQEITEAWGFSIKATLVWVKDRFGMGNYYRHQHELCVFAVKGKMRLSRMNASTVFNAPITRHSQKPEEFYRLVESCSPAPYLDVFARKKRAGWDVYGNEVATEYQGTLDGRESMQVG